MSTTRRSVCTNSSNSQISGDDDSLVGCTDVDTSLLFDSPLERDVYSFSPEMMDDGALEHDNGSGDEVLAKSPPTSVSSFTRDLLELRQKRQQFRRLRDQHKEQQSQMAATESTATSRHQPLRRFIFSDMQHWLSSGAEETPLADLVNRGDLLQQDVTDAGLKPAIGRKVSLSTIRKSQIAEYLRGLKCNGDSKSTSA